MQLFIYNPYTPTRVLLCLNNNNNNDNVNIYRKQIPTKAEQVLRACSYLASTWIPEL